MNQTPNEVTKSAATLIDEALQEAKGEMPKGELSLSVPDQSLLASEMQIHGTKQGLTIIWDNLLPFSDAKKRLEAEFKRSPLFYKDAVAHIGFESKPLRPAQQKKLGALCDKLGVLFRPLPRDYREQLKLANAYMVAKVLRSGQKIQYNGHIIVLGDVHAGSEVVAAGHVIVWGTLRGTAHAGAAGDSQAIICAIKLKPVQLRIADFVAVTEEVQVEEGAAAEIALIESGAIVARPWDAKSFYQLGISLER